MGRRFLLAAVVSAVLATVSVSPALAQIDLSGNAPPPPEYQVTEDGTLISGGDMRGLCSEVGAVDETLDRATPEVRAEAEQSSREAIRACESAGFDTAGDLPASASASSSASAPSHASTTASSATATGSASPSSSAANADTVLPDTGGPALPSPLLPAAAALLSAGGLLALRTRR